MDTLKSNRLTRSLIRQLERRDNGEIPNWLLNTVLFAGVLLVILNQTAMKTALPRMIADIGVSPSIGQWVVSGYTLLKGLMVPITAFAMTKFRTRNLFIVVMAIFGFGSLLAATGINFTVILFGTLFQGIAAGVVIPLMQTIILTVSPPYKRGSALGLMAVVTGIGPTFGPAIGGWIVDISTWNVLFYTWFIGSLIVIPLAVLVLYDVLPNSDPDIDWVSIRDSLIGFGLLLYGLSVIGSDGFDSVLAWLGIAIGLVFVYRFIRRNYLSRDPMLNIRLFKFKKFSLAVVIATLAFMILTGIANIMPMYIQSVRGLSATVSGLVILPGGLIKAVISPFVGRIYDKVGISNLGKIGGFLMFIGALMMVFLSGTTSIWLVALLYIVVSLGFGVFNIPITTLGMNALPNKQMSHGTSARQTVRQIGASFSVTLSFAFMTIFTGLSASNFAGSNAGLNITGIRGGFGIIAFLGLVSFILTFFLKDGKEDKK